MTYISTAGVFDGTKDGAPTTSSTRPNPINTYGASKYEGEKIVSGAARRVLHHPGRAGWSVGAPPRTTSSSRGSSTRCGTGRTTIHAVGDKLGTPTYTPGLRPLLPGPLDSQLYGLYHMACEGEGSRYDVAARILEVLGRDDIELVEVDSEFFRDEFPSERPRSEIMRNMALDLQGMNSMRPWPVALEEYLLTEFADLVAEVRVPA